jgi:hypothetical protein
MHHLRYQAASPCALGYLSLETLDALYSVDPRFCRVMRRNYFMLVMTWLKPTVPLLRYCKLLVPLSV